MQQSVLIKCMARLIGHTSLTHMIQAHGVKQMDRTLAVFVANGLSNLHVQDFKVRYS